MKTIVALLVLSWMGTTSFALDPSDSNCPNCGQSPEKQENVQSPARAHEILGDLCKAIELATKSGSVVSEKDLSSCTVLSKEQIPEKDIDNWKAVGKDYLGLLCLTHLSDGKRELPKNDNVNLFVPRKGAARFLGLEVVAKTSDLKMFGLRNGLSTFPQLKIVPSINKGCEKMVGVTQVVCSSSQEYCVTLAP